MSQKHRSSSKYLFHNVQSKIFPSIFLQITLLDTQASGIQVRSVGKNISTRASIIEAENGSFTGTDDIYSNSY